jgi:hypothetical protein
MQNQLNQFIDSLPGRAVLRPSEVPCDYLQQVISTFNISDQESIAVLVVRERPVIMEIEW